MLYFIATPIGNLSDISLRSLETLNSVDMIVAEDTRHTHILLSHFHISKPLESFHSYSSPQKLDALLRTLQQGKNVAYVTDAGTPMISDPGYRFLKKAIEANIPVTALPGPSAAINALVLSGLPPDRFYFLGFLPLKKGRKKMLQELSHFPHAMIVYESPFRLSKTIHGFIEVFGANRFCAVAREMTKKFEEIIRGPLGTIETVIGKRKIKGEVTIVIAGTKYKEAGIKNRSARFSEVS